MITSLHTRTRFCRQCPRGCGHIGRSKALRRHVHRKHGGVPDLCNTCNEPFLSTGALNQHTRAKHGSPVSVTTVE